MKFIHILLSFLLLSCAAYPGMAQDRGVSLKSEAEQHYEKGEVLLNKMKFEEAEEAFRKAIAVDSTFGLAYYRLASALEWQGQWAHKQSLEKALALIDRIPEEEQFLVRAQHAQGEKGYAAGIAILQEMEEIYPTNKEMMYMLGDFSVHKGDHATAEKYFTKALAMHPNFEHVLHHLTWTYQSMQSYPMMFVIAKRFSSISTSPYASIYLADAYIKTDNVDTGLQELLRAQDQNPDREGIRAGLALIYLHQGQIEKARDALSSIHDPDALFSIGWGLFYQAKYQEAQDAFRRGLESKSDNVALLNGLGWSLSNQKKYVDAEAFFLQAYEINPEHPAILNGLGRLKIINKEYDAAESYSRKMIQIFPAGRIYGEIRLGQIELLRKNYATAEQHLREALAIDSSIAWINVHMGYLFSEQKRFAEARTFAQQALAIDSVFGRYNLMGWVLIAGDLDVERGITFAQKALDSQPDDFLDRVNIYPYLALPEHTLGLAYLKKGQYQKAMQLLKSAAEQLPERQRIQDDLRLAKKKLKGKKHIK